MVVAQGITVLVILSLMALVFVSLGFYFGIIIVLVLAIGHVFHTLKFLSAMHPTFLPSLRFERRGDEMLYGGATVVGSWLDQDFLVVVYLSVTGGWGCSIISFPSSIVKRFVRRAKWRQIDKSNLTSLFEIIMTPDMLSEKDRKMLQNCRRKLKRLGCDCDMIFKMLPKSCILDEEGRNLYHDIFNIMKNYPLLTDHAISGFAWLGECEHRSRFPD